MGNVYRLRGQIVGNAAMPGTTSRLVTIVTGDDLASQFQTVIPAANSSDYSIGTVVWFYLTLNATDKATIEASAITVKQHRNDD